MNQPIGRSGLRPGVVVMHPSGNSTAPVKGAKVAMNEMRAFAQRGAVVIGIDAPYFRRGGSDPPTWSPLDRPEQIQLMKDLQRAVDVLLAQDNVDPARIGCGLRFADSERGARRQLLPSMVSRIHCAAGIARRFTKPYHSCTKGRAERRVRTLKEATTRAYRFDHSGAPAA